MKLVVDLSTIHLVDTKSRPAITSLVNLSRRLMHEILSFTVNTDYPTGCADISNKYHGLQITTNSLNESFVSLSTTL